VQVQVEEKSQAEKLVDVALGKAKKGTLKDKSPEALQEQEAAKLAEIEKCVHCIAAAASVTSTTTTTTAAACIHIQLMQKGDTCCVELNSTIMMLP
jgi:hypothetical protein